MMFLALLWAAVAHGPAPSAGAAGPGEPLGPCSRRTPFVISEIMYKPAPRLDGNNLEYIELYNSNPYFENLSGYQITGDIAFTLPTNTILQGHAFLVVAASPSSIQTVYGIANVVGPYAGSLKKSGLVQLNDNHGAVLLEVSYSNLPPWPVAADGTGHSIVLARPTYGEGDGRGWAISDMAGGSPGTAESYHPSPLRNVVINELLANAGTNLLQYVELYNHSMVSVDLSGCVLTDDATTNKFVIPASTVIPPAGFISFNGNQMGFALNPAGETLFFRNPDGSHILDAVTFEGQHYGAAWGRWPDGANDFYPLSARTPGSSNSNILVRDIVINELMYAPISGNDDDQYLELYNNGPSAVDLNGWNFTAGINFVFSTTTILAPGGYLVVARNTTNLWAHYPNLNAANTVGDYTGKLSHKGERVALAMPDFVIRTNGAGGWTTNMIQVVVDEVTYGTGGRWGTWANAGGSSLELINPNTNHRLAYNWGDSDETLKSSWTNLEYTGVLDNGANYNGAAIDLVQLGLLDVGECLADNIEVLPGTNGPNYISNSTFEPDLSGWTLLGDHIRSSLETAAGLGGYQSSQSLHLRSSDGVWTLADSAQGTLTNTTLAAGQTATLRLKARWLRGWPEVLMRLRGNWLEVTGPMPVPVNLGTPGLPNSRAHTNAGPAIYEIAHSPPLPPASQPLVVTARFHDFSGFSATLLWRVDTVVNPNPAYTAVPMVDDGTRGDAIARDGIYSATIPAQPAGTIVAFVVQAQDGSGASTVFPQDLHDGAGIPRECVVGFGDPTPASSFSTHHAFLTQNWAQHWAQGAGVSHEISWGTWVDGGGRIIYNWNGRNAGSPYHQYVGSPVTTVGGEHWQMPEDDMVFGTTSFNKQHVPGNGPLDDDTLQREQTSYWMAREIGLPFQNRRYYVYFVNGVRHAPLMEDSQVPGAEDLHEYFPNDSGGFLYKNHSWFEGDPLPQANGYMNFNNMSWCTLGKYTTTINGVPNQYKLARYRWMWWIRRWPDSANNFTNVFALIDAANTPTSNPSYYTKMEALVDTEQWMRYSAMEHVTGDWDSFFTQNQWNMYSYKPLNGKWAALKWDWNITLGGGTATWGPDGSQLFNVGSNDPIMGTFQNYPAYRRAYLRAFQDIANLAMNNSRVDPVLDAKYAAFVADGLTTTAYNGLIVNSPSAALKGWIATMHNSILTALTNQGVVNVPFAVNGPAIFNTGNNLLTLSGTAPVEVRTITVNGTAYPVTWPTVTGWQMSLVLGPSTNALVVQGFDGTGNPLSNLTATLSVVYTNPVPALAGGVAINEIMYNPVVPNAQYIELFNTSSYFTFDLSGWRLEGLSYTFPPNSWLAPGGFLSLAKDGAAFASAYGPSTPLFDVFPGVLSAEGQTVGLISPGTPDQIVNQVTYSSAAPWPVAADGGGPSLQLIDPYQDNNRVANWGVMTSNIVTGLQWQHVTLTGVATKSILLIGMVTAGDVYIDDLQLVAGTVPEVGLNYLQDGDFESPLTASWTVSPNMTNSSISTAVKHSGNASLHVVATSGGPLISEAIWQNTIPLVTNATYTLSYWYLPSTNGSSLLIRLSGSSPNKGHIYSLQSYLPPFPTSSLYTPDAVNTVRATLPPLLPVWLNEIQPNNTSGPTNLLGQLAPWVELYNGGTNAIDLTGFYLANNYTNLTQWAFPSNTLIGSRQFLMVWLDGNAAASTASELHANFTVPPATGSLVLVQTAGGWTVPTVLDYLNYNVPIAGYSYGDYPDGDVGGRRVFAFISPGATNNPAPAPLKVLINEWLTSNTHTLLNPADGKFDDWFELYNADTNSADLSGCYLTHSTTTHFEFQIPAGYIIPPRSYLLVWADKLPAANTDPQGDLHTSFRLPVTGGVIGLFATDGAQVDYVTYGPQTNDVSQGRCPDGGPSIVVLPIPTPRAQNSCPVNTNTPPVLAPIANYTLYLGQTLTFTATATDADAPPDTLAFSLTNAPAGAAIDPASGQFTWTPVPAQAPSTNVLTARVTDNGTPPLSASQNFTIAVLRSLQFATITRNGAQLTLGWATAPGKVYRLEYRDSLTAGTWQTLGGDIPATGTTTTFSVPLSILGQRFYRLLVLN